MCNWLISAIYLAMTTSGNSSMWVYWYTVYREDDKEDIRYYVCSVLIMKKIGKIDITSDIEIIVLLKIWFVYSLVKAESNLYVNTFQSTRQLKILSQGIFEQGCTCCHSRETQKCSNYLPKVM